MRFTEQLKVKVISFNFEHDRFTCHYIFSSFVQMSISIVWVLINLGNFLMSQGFRVSLNNCKKLKKRSSEISIFFINMQLSLERKMAKKGIK